LKPHGNNQLERVVVLTRTIKLVGAALLNAIVAGNEQLAPVGAPLQLSEAVPLNPSPPIDNVYIALCPAETDADAEPPEGTPRPILAATPVPVSGTVCGLLAALSVMVSVPLPAPTLVGL
jgi:hypothetical protein